MTHTSELILSILFIIAIIAAFGTGWCYGIAYHIKYKLLRKS